MMKRLILIASVLLLSVSGWSQFAAAAFCPHSQEQIVLARNECHVEQVTVHEHGEASSHQGMTMDGMEGMEAGEVMETASPAHDETPAAHESANQLGPPIGDCAHCFSHSRPQPVPLPGITTEQSKRGAADLAPPETTLAATPVMAFGLFITQRTHAPPGATISRHVLINVFRI
jgi:hypothetical protein